MAAAAAAKMEVTSRWGGYLKFIYSTVRVRARRLGGPLARAIRRRRRRRRRHRQEMQGAAKHFTW